MNREQSEIAEQVNALLEPITVREISKLDYFIPDYQRGYRWTEIQVEQLLDDIYNFESKSLTSNEDTWYCLQPLVVKEMNSFPDEFEGDQNKKWMEVIDGQQRLTTAFLIVHYINEMFRGQKKDAEPILLYQTRKNSTKFLGNINVSQDIEHSNIDYFHISTAYKTIHKWFDENNINSDKFIGKFYDSTKVIWYQTFELDSIEIFTRINTGKIQLTNAELVKALFLNSSNFENSETIYHKQLQIALDWENIEYSLHNDYFWDFINKEKNDLPTRIEFLLDIIKRKDGNIKDEHYTFSQYYNDFKDKDEGYIFDKWYEIKQTYLVLLEWFNSALLHNKVGFLIYCDMKGYSLREILDKYGEITKSDFESFLDQGISSFLKSLGSDLEKIEYKNNQSILRKILLLHNIETMNQNKSDDAKFPFTKFKDKKNGWDIEHIGSIAEKLPELDAHRKAWVDEAIKYITDVDLQAKCENWSNETFTHLFYEIVGYFEGNHSSNEDTTNSLGNLALLDSKTNRGYKNSVFPEKRSKIIEKDKNGQFIPICTKNLFMKYYSGNTEHLYFWTQEDRADYLKNIVDTLSIYTNEQ
jgi:uncharacterized protein with ParB-like and HNH nuclease domain